MSLYDIYIPTFKRPISITTNKIFPNGYIVCPESQLDEYKKYNPESKFLPCPDAVEGNMARKRNWIKDNAKKDWFIMMDDDIDHFQYVENLKQLKIPLDRLEEIFLNGFVMCEDAGTVLWGINLQTDPRFYSECIPFGFISVVLGPFNGHIKSNLRYDERFPTKEDYDYSLQVLKRYHKILRLNKYSYKAKHIQGQEGGSHSLRSMELEESQNILLQKKWGKKVVKFNMKKDIDPIISVPLKGV